MRRKHLRKLPNGTYLAIVYQNYITVDGIPYRCNHGVKDRHGSRTGSRIGEEIAVAILNGRSVIHNKLTQVLRTMKNLLRIDIGCYYRYINGMTEGDTAYLLCHYREYIRADENYSRVRVMRTAFYKEFLRTKSDYLGNGRPL